MRYRMASLLVLAFALVVTATPASGSDERKLEELQREIADLRRQVEDLQQAAAPGQAGDAEEIERRIEILAAEIEKLRIGDAAVSAEESRHGLGPAASKVYAVKRGVSVGGYGELLYQNFDSEREDGQPSGATDQFDLLRAVLYFGYKFNDRLLFNSEIEFEHASTGADGEVSVEFAYIDWLARDEVSLRAGLLLVPMGFLNELHEPTVFLGTSRPETERRILPTTWRENGVGIFGDLGPVSYRAYVVNGLDASGFTAEGLRDGRQDGAKAKAGDLAAVARVDYVGVPGLVAGVSAYSGDSGQDLAGLSGGTLDVGTTIVEGHVDWRWRGLRVRALAARAELDDVAELNATLGLVGAESVGEELSGGYVEAGYDVLAGRGTSASLVPFARWESLDTQDVVPAGGGFLRDPAQRGSVTTVGLAWQPIPQLVVKVDYQDRDNDADTGVKQVNAGLGWVF